MSIDAQYRGIYDQTRNLQNKFHDFVGPTNPTTNAMRQEMEHLASDIETGKNPRDIENRIKTIQNHMTQVEHQGQNLMSYEHGNAMHHDFEAMRRDVRGFSHY